MANTNWVPRWFKPWPFHPRSLEVTNNHVKGSLDLTIPKRSQRIDRWWITILIFTYRYHDEKDPSLEDGSLKIPLTVSGNKQIRELAGLGDCLLWRWDEVCWVEPYVSVPWSQKSLFGVVFFFWNEKYKAGVMYVGILLNFSHYYKDSFYEMSQGFFLDHCSLAHFSQFVGAFHIFSQILRG